MENYHAVLQHVASSVRTSLQGKGPRTLVINDEAHHVANETDAEAKKWKEFLLAPDFSFRHVIGLSGTCYVGNRYFADVIHRYSLKTAIEERFVKRVDYVVEQPRNDNVDERWQLIHNRHMDATARLAPRGLKPLSIVVTQTIATCKDVAEELRAFLVDSGHATHDDVDDRVLAVYNGAPTVAHLDTLDLASSPVEWFVAVSMLNEGWDVKRVFLIVPHEERAFNSKLLIAQVLGRGLRIPEGWQGDQPQVTVFNHDAWARRIKLLVDEILEIDKRLTSRINPGSGFNFDLHNIDYTLEPVSEQAKAAEPAKLFPLGYVDVPSDAVVEEVTVDLERADAPGLSRWFTSIRRKTYSADEVAEVMRERMEQALLDDEGQPTTPGDAQLLSHWTHERLADVVMTSLARVQATEATEKMRQRFLQSLGSLRRKPAEVVRFRPLQQRFVSVSTTSRQAMSVAAQELHTNRSVFYSSDTRASLADEQQELFDEVTEVASAMVVCVRPGEQRGRGVET